jgi:Carboxypeptidase regulatory-like domain/TonB dependent receptor-like, beta-barrel
MMKRSSANSALWLLSLGLLLALVLTTSAVFAQSIISGEITGTVTDSSGAVLPNATVTLTSKDSGSSQTVTTSASGGFRFPLLRPGVYTLTATANGFSKLTQDVTAGVGQVTNTTLQLKVGTSAETIEVTGAAPLLETENANIATTYTPSQIENIPNPGGDLTNYALSTPGVVLSTGAGYGNFTAYGMPGTSNLYTINGGDMNDPYNNLNNSGSSNNMLGQNEIQEVAVVHNGYTGQYGRGASVNMNFTTKSGTNSFHGNAKWDWNGRYLNANDWFNNNTNTPRPFANSNEWGGSIGGPIVKNKLFFYFDSEGLRYVLPGGGTPVYVPTAQWASAVQANIDATQPAESAFYQQMFALYAGAPGGSGATPVQVGDSTTPQGGCGDFAGTTLGGVTYGTAGGQPCTKTFRSLLNNLNKERLMAVRIDYVLSEKDRINGRYWQDRGVQPTYTDPINAGFNQQSVQPQDAGQFSWNHLFNPNLVNQLIVGGFYYSAIFGDIKKSVALFPTTIGVAAGGNACYLLDGNLSCAGGEAYRFPQGRNIAQYQLVDDVSWTKGNHGLKFGVNFRRIDYADYSPGANSTGDLRMSSITDFVNGVLSSSGGSVLRQQFSPFKDRQINGYSLGFYGQDEWRATSNLKLTLSLRLDRNGNETCTEKCFVHFAGDFLNGISHNPSTPYNQSVLAGQSSLFPGLERIVWEPRAGFAWSPGFHKTTVIRGGAGLFSDLYPAQLSSNLITNPPNIAIWTVAAGATPLPIAPGIAGGAFSQAAANNSAFQSGFANGGTLASIQAQVPTFKGPNFYSTNQQMLNPRYAEWNLEVEQAFGEKMVANINYVGNHGSKLLQLVNGANAFVKPTKANPNPTFGSLLSTPIDARFGVVTNLTNNGISNYNGVTASLSRRLTKGFTGTLGYTYSHSLDTISNAGIDQYSTNQVGDSLRYQVDPQNLHRLNYGNADYDFRHVLSLNYVWEVPFMAKNRFIGGWTVSGVLFKRSGQPYSVVNTTIPTRTLGNYTATGALVLADFLGGPTPNCTVNRSSDPAAGQQVNPFPCLSASQFATTGTQADFGNVARNRFRGPGYFDTDLSIKKSFRITESGVAFVMGANAYNILNHPNFGNPDSSVTSGTFGTIQNTVTPASSPYGNFQGAAVSGRILQLELNLKF